MHLPGTNYTGIREYTMQKTVKFIKWTNRNSTWEILKSTYFDLFIILSLLSHLAKMGVTVWNCIYVVYMYTYISIPGLRALTTLTARRLLYSHSYSECLELSIYNKYIQCLCLVSRTFGKDKRRRAVLRDKSKLEETSTQLLFQVWHTGVHMII